MRNTGQPSTHLEKVQGTVWEQEKGWSGSHYQGLPVHADGDDVHALALEMLRAHIGVEACILDVGAGAGAFSQRLLDHGYWKLEAVELRSDAFAVPEVPVHALDLNDAWAEQLAGRADAVVSLEVIEHLENPWQFARQCAAAVRPGGWVLLSTPNIESSRSRIEFLLGGEFRFFRAKDFTGCGHITGLTATQMERVGARAGLELIEYRHSRHKGWPRPRSRRKALRAILYALAYPFMNGRKRGEVSLFLFRRGF
jgi:2-polyprenyl-3-methyl-5-hydroxy-6-metoxy-1,4-benzoquinol methylase